ncbi:hypothetical protein ACFE04_021432 [Oxalis oulophora]
MNKVIIEHFKVEPNGAGQFEVIDEKRTFMVNLINRKCSCQRWCLSRVPCFHACANIFKNQEDPSNYVHSLLSKETCRSQRNHFRDELEKGGATMTRNGQAKTCNICNKLGHNKRSCPDSSDKDVKPPRKP